MDQQSPSDAHRSTLAVSTEERPDFHEQLVAYFFDGSGKLTHHAPITNGMIDTGRLTGAARLVIAPALEDGSHGEPKTLDRLLKLGGYDVAWRRNGRPIDKIVIPGPIIDCWPFCRCLVTGHVIRESDHLPVCHALVHICEIDRLPILIGRLPDRELFRLRDDLIAALRHPPVPLPPLSDPLTQQPDRTNGHRDALDHRFTVSATPPSPVLRFVAIEHAAQTAQPTSTPLTLSSDVHAGLFSTSATVVRQTLTINWKLLVPWFCIWRHWWWLFRTTEIAVAETDDQGRFSRSVLHRCHGDPLNLYFWVEYDFGTGFQTIYRPGIACNIHWGYVCGSDVTIPIADPRVPGCNGEPDLPGKQVVVMSIGDQIAVRDVGSDGLTTGHQPFGGVLDLRVDFSRTELINSGIPYYRWSYQRTNGTPPDANGVWTPMLKDVYRHYVDGTSRPSALMGPMPTTGPGAAPAADLFRILPIGQDWVTIDSDDLATAYFETTSLPGTPVQTSPRTWSDDAAAGDYWLKLELFDDQGNMVTDWTAHGIDLRITDQDAPFGTQTITTSPAPAGNHLIGSGGLFSGFCMKVHVDNNRCFAAIHPLGGTVTPDADCGFHEYAAPSDTAAVSFTASHPHDFATYGFNTGRGNGPVIAAVSTSGTVGSADGNGFGSGAAALYEKTVTVGSLLGACANAAFWEQLYVAAMATNGYRRLSEYDAADAAAFALAQPCPDHPTLP